MYHDLGLKMVRCPNEAEFRAYIVLLNLQNTNFLWEVNQLRDDIKQSPEIQFAIKIYLAFESNNYVRFFQLVRSTTYMNACILLRYFTQVRVKALEIMFKAYVPRSEAIMSIGYMTYLLAFEDYGQCADFLEYYGIKCVRDKDLAKFDRNTFEYPDTPYLLERALNVVEHKRQTTVGEAVHGIPLDTKDVLDGYEPHNSFDDKGFVIAVFALFCTSLFSGNIFICPRCIGLSVLFFFDSARRILLPSAWTSGDQDYFRPEARIESRAAKLPSVQPKSDESVFKVPALLPRSSPKQRLSPKPASTEAPPDHLFGGSSKFGAPTTAPPNNLFAGNAKSNTTPASDANIFGSFGGFKPQPANPTALKAAKPLLASPAPVAAKRDVTDSLFARPANKTSPASANIFATNLAQKPDPSKTLFSNHNLFASSTIESTSIFGGFQSPAAKAKPESSKGLTFTPSAFSKPAATNLFGGAASNPPAAQSLATAPTPPNAAKRAEPEDPYDQAEIGELERLRADLIEMERKEREREEQEAKQKAELEERERQRRLEAERIDRQRLERELKRKQVDEAAATLVDGLMGEVLAQDVQRLVQEEADRYRKLNEAVQQLYDSILNDVIAHDLEVIAADLKCTWEKNVLQRFFSGWQMYARKRRQQRAIIAHTPQWMPTRPREQLLPELQHPLQARTLSLMKRYRSGQPMKLVVPPQREDTLDIWSIVWPALAKLRAKQQRTAAPSAVYWKCVISTPDADEDPSHATIDRWLSNVFTRQASAYPRQPDTFFAEQSSGDGHCVAVCMRKLCGTKMWTEAQRAAQPTDAHGTNAVLFFLSAKNLRGARDRLRNVLKCVELSDACALVIYGGGANDAVHVKNVLRVDELLNIDNADECFFANGINHRHNATLGQLTKHGLRYAAHNSFYDDRLQMQQTASFLRVTLSDELWHRIHLSINGSATLRLAAKSFAFLRDYHNESIDRLIGLCTPDCTDSPALFPPELRQFVPAAHQFDIPLGLAHFPEHWHLHIGRQQQRLATFFQALRVHGAIDTGDIGDVAALEQRICQFVHTHITAPADARRTAYKIIENILGHLQSSGNRTHGGNFAAQLADYNWLDVWPTFAVDLLAFQYERACAAGQLAGYVIYDRYEYQEYTKSPWWLQVNEPLLKRITEQVERDVDNAIDDYELESKRQKLDETIVEQENAELQQALARGYAVLCESEKKLSAIKANRTLALDISKDFDMDLYRQERQMRDTKDYLKSLNGN